jgi:phage minor capsid protein 2
MPILNRASNERELERLRSVFLKAETDIINEIGRLRSRGLVDYHAVAALERVQGILQKLESDCWEYVPRMIERQFYVRHPDARKPLDIPETPEKHLLAYQNALALTTEQMNIIQRLVMNLMGEITDASINVMTNLQSALIGRVEPDVYRRIGLEQIASMQASGMGVKRSTPGFVEALRRDGVTAFTDKAGRNWSLHTYGSMVCRTTSRQAEILAVLTVNPEHDLYKISSHGTTCGLCAPYEGRVYSKSGKDPDFPPLAIAFGKVDPDGPNDLSNTWLNIHPNCLHVLTAWTAAGRSAEEIQRIKDFSDPKKNPFSRDPRTQKQIDSYRKKEADRARWLRDYHQWERYRETLGDHVPKTFQTFQNYKATNGDRYRLWKLDYRRRRDLLAHPEKALPGSDSASAADAKFTKYIFGGNNQDGLAKGRAFSSRLGYNADNWQDMQKEIISSAAKYPAQYRNSTAYGKQYSQDVILYGKTGNPANVRIGWIVHPDGTAYMVTAHVKEI